MARRKKKKSSNFKSIAASGANATTSSKSATLAALSEDIAAPLNENATPVRAQIKLDKADGSSAPEKIRKKKNADIIQTPQATRSGKVSWLTCVAGMFLTLVLGVYIGTLLPGIYSDLNKSGSQSASMAPTPEMPALNVKPTVSPLKRHIEELEKRTTQNPDSVPAWIGLGNLYFDAEMPPKAIMAYEKALQLAPNNADVLTDLGIMYRETGDYTKALESFRKALAVDPQHQNAMFNEGVVLAHDLHKPEEASAAWKKLLGINPDAKTPNGVPLSELIGKLGTH